MIPDPYSERTMKRKLEDIKGIVIKNIVSRKTTVVSVLNEFRSKNTVSMSDNEWKKYIIESAAELVKAEIDEKKDQRDLYPDISDISDIEKQYEYVPQLLRYFLEVILKSRKTKMKTAIAAISQAIMQQQRPRSIMAPLIFALTMRVHDDCPGLLNDLFKCGFCMSEDEANLFKS